MGRSLKNRLFRPSALLERLERREVFAGDLPQTSLVDSLPPETIEQRVLREFVAGKYFTVAPATGQLIEPTSQSSFDTKLKELVGQYWDGLLGKTLNQVTPRTLSPFFGESLQLSVIEAGGRAIASQALDSITNTRHVGIDEGDTADVTGDGFLFTVAGNAIHVIDLENKSNAAASRIIELENSLAQLMVVDDWLIVLENTYGGLAGHPLNFGANGQTKIRLYDISQPVLPLLVSTTLVEGANRAARFVDGQLTLVVDNSVVLPAPRLVGSPDGVERFESLDSYFASNRDEILAALQPNYSQTEIDGVFADSVDIGAWDDLAFANESLTQSTSLLKLALVDGSLSLIDSETITGTSNVLVYQAEEDIYLVASSMVWAEPKSHIYKVDVTGAGQLDIVGAVEVKGLINDTTWLNEHAGILQVATLGRTMVPNEQSAETNPWLIANLPVFTQSANVATIGETGDGWKLLGKLEDIAPGQSLLAANFIEDKAVLTTGVITQTRVFDPLHGIDLSDPANPRELSELTIPGFTTYLKQVDETHWLGLGFDQDPNDPMNSHLQVSLYRVEDLANPVVVDRWVSPDILWAGGWVAQNVSFDVSTGLLTMVTNQMRADGSLLPTPVLKIDVDADDPLQLLGGVELPEALLRSFTIGDLYVAITNHSIQTFDVDDLSTPLNRAYLSNYAALNYQFWSVMAGQSQSWKLADTWHGEPFEIIGLQTAGPISATLNSDQSITLSAPSTASGASQSLEVTLRFQSGRTEKFSIALYVHFIPEGGLYSDSRGSLNARFTDEAGNAVTEIAEGDEVWVTVSAADSRDFPQGVFAAYMDVTFISGNVTVVGDIEHLGVYTNGASGTVTASGIYRLGGFGGATLPGEPSSDIARFKLRINDDQPVTINVTANRDQGNEFLLHGESRALNPDRIAPGVLTSAVATASERTVTSRAQDVSGDGVVTALDALVIINFINAQAESAGEMLLAATQVNTDVLDITGDGVISGLDVLQIINTINARNEPSASGESASSEGVAVDLEAVSRRR